MKGIVIPYPFIWYTITPQVEMPDWGVHMPFVNLSQRVDYRGPILLIAGKNLSYMPADEKLRAAIKRFKPLHVLGTAFSLGCRESVKKAGEPEVLPDHLRNHPLLTGRHVLLLENIMRVKPIRLDIKSSAQNCVLDVPDDVTKKLSFRYWVRHQPPTAFSRGPYRVETH